ncbi:hypothetical protein FRC01_012289 [Tulasnella sp. 417]|nr:hypothetical protein FRC01_012289 [Tulasnella sp. 417]
MSTVASGRYLIFNAGRQVYAVSPDDSGGASLVGGDSAPQNRDQWAVTRLSNGRYTIQNIGTGLYASVASRALTGIEVTGESDLREWDISGAQVRRSFLISSTDTGRMWGLPSNTKNTRVALADADTGRLSQNHWRFELIDQGAESIPGGQGVPAAISSQISLSTGRTDWTTARKDLGDGMYRITNVSTKTQLVVFHGSERIRVVGPVQLWNGPNVPHLARCWHVRFNENGLAAITSTWSDLPGSMHRSLALGPIVRPETRYCRLYRVPGQDASVYFISTDTSSNPPLVIQDPQTTPLDCSTPMTDPISGDIRSQFWTFAKWG